MEELIIPEEEKHAILSYLCSRGQILNQIEVFDHMWSELLLQPTQRGWLRLLRINLRRLRSAVVLLGPILPPSGAHWLEFLKKTAEQLGNVREYDVAVRGCEKYAAAMANDENARAAVKVACGEDAPLELENMQMLLQQKRDVQTQLWLENAREGCIAEALKDLMQLLENEEEVARAEKNLAKEFFRVRLADWSVKLSKKLNEVDASTSYTELHKVRIKVKRFRYAYDVYMRNHVDVELLEALKDMQDILGSIHDGERNIEIMTALAVPKYSEALGKELACYKAWREQKIKQRLAEFPEARTCLLECLKHSLSGNKLNY